MHDVEPCPHGPHEGEHDTGDQDTEQHRPDGLDRLDLTAFPVTLHDPALPVRHGDQKGATTAPALIAGMFAYTLWDSISFLFFGSE